MAKCTRRTRRAFARVGSGTSLCLRYRLPPAAQRLPGAHLSKAAKQRLRWLDYARTHSVAQTCRHFGGGPLLSQEEPMTIRTNTPNLLDHPPSE